MSTFVDDGFLVHNQRATTEVIEIVREVRVTYSNSDGRQFRVLVRQKPNAIGFHARLPGDGKKRG